MDAFQQQGGNEGWDPQEISARGLLLPKIKAILQLGSPCGSDPPARGGTNVKAETRRPCAGGRPDTGSQESNVQDVPAPAKQSLSAAETSVRVTRARALQAVVLSAPCSGRASSPATDVTKCAAARKWPGSLRSL